MNAITPTKSFIIDGSERSVQDTISKLKFISKIEEGDIVDVQTLTTSKISYWTSIYRTTIARDESRERTLDFFRRTLHDAFELAESCMRERKDRPQFFDELVCLILNSIKEAKSGILNHAKTYGSDKMHESKIDALLLSVNARLKDMMNLFESKK